MLLSAGTPSVWRWSEPVSILRIQVSLSWVEQIAFTSEDRDRPSCLQVHNRLPFRDRALEVIGRELLEELTHPQAGSRLCVDALATVLAVHLLRAHQDVQHPKRGDTSAGLPPRRLRHVLEYLEANLTGRTSLVKLSAAAGLSPFHFSRLFKRSTGMTPHAYVIGKKLERAKGLLHKEESSLADIASMCGFSDQNHLTSVFRKVFGLTPGAYRRSVTPGSEHTFATSGSRRHESQLNDSHSK